LHIRLESPLENPEERTGFKHPDLLRWIDSERKRLVGSALTLLRAYTLAGLPYQGGLWGSFESWSRLIPGAIVWAGGVDPIIARASADESLDDEKRNLVILIEALRRLCPSNEDGSQRPLTARAIVDALYPDRDPRDGPAAPDGYEVARDAIEQETRCHPGRSPEARRLGKWLQRVRGRVVSGWYIQRQDGPGHTAAWRSVPAAT
jgi:hypothetical protein